MFQIESCICVEFNQFCNVIWVEAFRFEEEDDYQNEIKFQGFFSRIFVKSTLRKASLYIFFTRKDNTVVLVEGAQND